MSHSCSRIGAPSICFDARGASYVIIFREKDGSAPAARPDFSLHSEDREDGGRKRPQHNNESMREGERIYIITQTHLDHLIPVVDSYGRYEFRREDILIEPQNERRLPAGRIPDHEEPDYVRPLGPHLERSGGSGAPPPPAHAADVGLRHCLDRTLSIVYMMIILLKAGSNLRSVVVVVVADDDEHTSSVFLFSVSFVRLIRVCGVSFRAPLKFWVCYFGVGISI